MKSCITALICGCISGIIIGLIAIRPISTTIPKATQSQPVIYDTIRCKDCQNDSIFIYPINHSQIN